LARQSGCGLVVLEYEIMQPMKPTMLKDRYQPVHRPFVAGVDEKYNVKVAIVYQDEPARQWAGRVRDRLAGLVGESVVHCTEWKTGDLIEPRTYSQGVAALAQADVIVVSIHEARRLPPAFYMWVNLWLQVRSGLPGALVALVTPAEGLEYGSGETRRYLCAVAGQGGLELLECSQPNEPIGQLVDSFPWATAA
jgi:hypothetical protein